MKEITATNQSEPLPQFVTAGQIAKIYNVTSSAVRFWANKGKIPSLRFEGTIRFDLAAVRATIEGGAKS